MIPRRSVLAGMALLLGSAGCYGKFGLTKKVYDWNGSLGDKWLVWLVFLLLAFFPVYGLCLFIDALLFNTIEFWTGNNPMAINTVAPDGTEVAITKVEGQPNVARVTTRTPGGETKTVFIEKLGEDAFAVRDEQGKLCTRIRPVGDQVELFVAGAPGEPDVVQMIPKKRLKAMQEQIRAGVSPSAALQQERPLELSLRAG